MKREIKRVTANITDPLKEGIKSLIRIIIEDQNMRELQEWGIDNGIDMDNDGNINLDGIDIPQLQGIYSDLEILAFGENSDEIPSASDDDDYDYEESITGSMKGVNANYETNVDIYDDHISIWDRAKKLAIEYKEKHPKSWDFEPSSAVVESFDFSRFYKVLEERGYDEDDVYELAYEIAEEIDAESNQVTGSIKRNTAKREYVSKQKVIGNIDYGGEPYKVYFFSKKGRGRIEVTVNAYDEQEAEDNAADEIVNQDLTDFYYMPNEITYEEVYDLGLVRLGERNYFFDLANIENIISKDRNFKLPKHTAVVNVGLGPSGFGDSNIPKNILRKLERCKKAVQETIEGISETERENMEGVIWFGDPEYDSIGLNQISAQMYAELEVDGQKPYPNISGWNEDEYEKFAENVYAALSVKDYGNILLNNKVLYRDIADPVSGEKIHVKYMLDEFFQ
jgi:hypothetical protein